MPPESKKTKVNGKKIVKILGNAIAVLALVFLVKRILSFDIDYSVYLSINTIILFVVFVLVSAFAIFVSSQNWRILLEFTAGKKLMVKDTFSVYAKANIGKYIPGNVMQFVGRNIMGGRLGVSQTSITISSVLEIAFLVFTCTVISLFFAGKDFVNILLGYLKQIHIFIVLGICFAVVCMAIIVLYIVYKKFNKTFLEIKAMIRPAFFAVLGKSFLMSFAVQLVSGFILSCIVNINGMPFSTALYMQISAAYTVSWLIGFAVPGAPGGIGIRETVLVLLLAGACGESVILSAAIFQRIIFVLADVAAYLFQYLPMLRERKPTKT